MSVSGVLDEELKSIVLKGDVQAELHLLLEVRQRDEMRLPHLLIIHFYQNIRTIRRWVKPQLGFWFDPHPFHKHSVNPQANRFQEYTYHHTTPTWP